MAKANGETRPRLTASDIRQLLRSRYPDRRYAMFDEVRNAAGFDANRSADVLVMGLWPSDGLRLIGIEVKVSRSDYLRELQNPKKAEDVAPYCDYWYLAVERGVIPDLSMVPETWGVLEVTEKGDGLREIKRPTLNATPVPLDRSFLAAILKRAQESEAPRSQLKEAEKKGQEHGKWMVKRAEEERDKLKARIDEFEAASGVEIDCYGGAGKIGEAVAAVLRARDNARYSLHGKIGDVEHLLRALREIAGVLDEIAAPVEQPPAPPSPKED